MTEAAPPFLPFALPDITEREIAEVADTLRSGWITTGPRTKRFEAEFAAAVGAPYAVAVNSCTAALHLALEAIGVGPDDEVLVPTTTFAASAEVVRYLGARPVLVDVRADDGNLDVDDLERHLTSRTRAVIPVHLAGNCCDMDPLVALARARDLVVIEDAAHAFPARYQGRPAGTLGDLGAYSFYATKTITTGEGGMAVTAREDWAERMRIMALHGISKDAWKRYSAEGSWYYEIVAPGYKYNLTDVAAALGLVQLARAGEMLDKRRAIARRYQAAFAALDALTPLGYRSFDDHAWHLFVVELRDGALAIDRNRFIEELKTRGVGTSVHFIPLHLHPYYRDTYGYRPEDLPRALDHYRRCLSLPIFSAMTDGQVERVIDTVHDVVRKFRT